MDIATVCAGIAIFFYGRRQETSGAGLPLMVAGIFVTLFGLVWTIANRTHWLPE